MNTLTEEEAKTKWCPFARTPIYIDIAAASTNRNLKGGALPSSSCIGSSCMSWRWESYASRDNPTRAPGAGHSFDLTRGYCGLAGRP
jgi:hypothetical protein